ncbi:MAG TPA: glutathione peroxidase [Casimicrobiaceae bacterium]
MSRKRTALGALAIAVAGVALVAAALALLDRLGREFVTDALGPIATLSGESGDEASGNAPAREDHGERFLPVPAPLEDDRVVEAIGPLVKLTCRRDDPIEPVAQGGAHPDALDAPLASQRSEVQQLRSGPLLAAAIAPLALVAAPQPADASRKDQVEAADAPADCPPLLRHRFNRLQTGESQSLCQFRGKVLLVVNTASYCGYTGQYEGLEALYRRYKGRGLVVVGFPSNDFGGQEPGTNQEIAQFCRLTYGVEFPMFEKSSVTKVAANPLFAELSAATGVAPQWNFYKYVVDRNGKPVAGFASRTTPADREFLQMIERLLAEKAEKAL